MRLILGDSLPNTHHQLVTLAQEYFTALRTLHHVTLSKVAGHSGIIGNELADSLAKKGVQEYGSLGRFSGSRTAALSPPDIGYNTDQWLSLSPDEQNLRFFRTRKALCLSPSAPTYPNSITGGLNYRPLSLLGLCTTFCQYVRSWHLGWT